MCSQQESIPQHLDLSQFFAPHGRAVLVAYSQLLELDVHLQQPNHEKKKSPEKRDRPLP
jgi:hypothetical protein